ncbi:peptidyl-alpha-hydroxyglycine alpha-amidating lyase 1 isoform X2 [Bradysia coprophila]|uniref:peptidyl-alpha-hydroxyglycine alpha-amidating lyase 1 isoform X2 n=1 Tax=Bradysia coprophila TaxID=38358 RepID=UPI00187DD60F|nr:peptidyl-alpha-hydroxyglycine alpha-amidating lyase 1 isoform X2 [Bradysia coprophila]
MSSSDLINWLVVIVSVNICSTLSQQIYNPTNDLPVRYLPTNDEELSRFDPKILDMGDRKQWRNLPQSQPIDVKQEIEKLNTTHLLQSTWPTPSRKLGTVSQVSFDLSGNVVVFHRGDNVWNSETFSIRNEYQGERVPIKDNTLIAFNRTTGSVVYEYGKDLFYMPHGLTIDHEGNVWVTDVALHQVMKFNAKGDMKTPEITLGMAFKPGPSKSQFCKPTAVAVLPDGQFFVSDGYCNSRILKYSKEGKLLFNWGQNSFQGQAFDVAPENYFAIPHALALVPEMDLLCVADRENGRVQCFYTLNGTFHSQYHSPIIGDRLFSVAYAPIQGGQLFVVNGPTLSLKPEHYNEVRGYVIDMKTKNVVGKTDQQFSNPHDIIVSADGMEVYVAELNPTKAYKFLSVNYQPVNQSSLNAKPVTLDDPMVISDSTRNLQKAEPGATALLVISLVVVFALLTIGIALLISRRRKRGTESQLLKCEWSESYRNEM